MSGGGPLARRARLGLLLLGLVTAGTPGRARGDGTAPATVEELDRRATLALWLALTPEKRWTLADVTDENVRRLDQFRVDEATGRRAWGVTFGVAEADGSGRGYFRITKNAGLPSLGEAWSLLSRPGAWPEVLANRKSGATPQVVVRSDEGSVQLSVMQHRPPGEPLSRPPPDLLARHRRLHAAAVDAGLIARLRLSVRIGEAEAAQAAPLGEAPVFASVGEGSTRLRLRVETLGPDEKPVVGARHAVRLTGPGAATASVDGASPGSGALHVLEGRVDGPREVEVTVPTSYGFISGLHAAAADGRPESLTLEVRALLGGPDARSFEAPDVREVGEVRLVAWTPCVTRFKVGITEDEADVARELELGPRHFEAWSWLEHTARVRAPDVAYAENEPLLSGWHAVPVSAPEPRTAPSAAFPGFRIRAHPAVDGITLLAVPRAHDGSALPQDMSLHFDWLGSVSAEERARLLPRFRLQSFRLSLAPAIDHLPMARAALGVERSQEQFHRVLQAGGAAEAPWLAASPWHGTVPLAPGVHELRAQATVVGRVSEAEPELSRTVRVSLRVAITPDEESERVPPWGPIHAQR